MLGAAISREFFLEVFDLLSLDIPAAFQDAGESFFKFRRMAQVNCFQVKKRDHGIISLQPAF